MKEEKKNPKIKNGLKKNEKIEMKDRSQKMSLSQDKK